MDIKNDKEVESFYHWMSYRGYDNFTDICVDFYYLLDSINDCSEYKVNGLRCSLKFSTMNKIRLFISWMATKMTDDNFKLYAELLIFLTREQFSNSRQEDMERLCNMSRPSQIEPHTPDRIWSFIPLFLFFNMSINGFQDASAWVTEGLALQI